MKVNIENLNEYSLPELITIYRFCKDRWNFLNDEYLKVKTNEKGIEILKYYNIGLAIEKIIDTRINYLISE